MLHVEKIAGLRSVDNLVERVGFGGRWIGVERDVFGGEEMLGDVFATGFVADVFIGGAAGGGRGWGWGWGGSRGGGVVLSKGVWLLLRFDNEMSGFW